MQLLSISIFTKYISGTFKVCWIISLQSMCVSTFFIISSLNSRCCHTHTVTRTKTHTRADTQVIFMTFAGIKNNQQPNTVDNNTTKYQLVKTGTSWQQNGRTCSRILLYEEHGFVYIHQLYSVLWIVQPSVSFFPKYVLDPQPFLF